MSRKNPPDSRLCSLNDFLSLTPNEILLQISLRLTRLSQLHSGIDCPPDEYRLRIQELDLLKRLKAGA